MTKKTTKKAKTRKAPVSDSKGTHPYTHINPLVLSGFDRRRTRIRFEGQSRTDSTFAADAMTRNIIHRFVSQGIPLPQGNPQYGDQPNGDFQDAQFSLAQLRSEFENLTPDQQAQFGDANAYANALFVAGQATDGGTPPSPTSLPTEEEPEIRSGDKGGSPSTTEQKDDSE